MINWTGSLPILSILNASLDRIVAHIKYIKCLIGQDHAHIKYIKCLIGQDHAHNKYIKYIIRIICIYTYIQDPARLEEGV